MRSKAAAEISASSAVPSASAPAAALSGAWSTVRALGIATTLDPCARTQASQSWWTVTPRRAAIAASTGWAGSFRVSRPPPVGL